MILGTSAIWEAFGDKLRVFIARRVSNPQDADDILQDVFVKIHTHIDTLENEERLTSWIYQIARNAIVDYYRRRRPDEDLPESLAVDPEPIGADPEAEIASGLHSMIAALPEMYQQAIVLADLEGAAHKEIAGQLGMSVSGVKSRVQRGRLLLKNALLECCHFEFDRRGNMVDYSPRPDCCRRCCV